MRSRLTSCGGFFIAHGIISACAEQTRPRGSSWRPRRDHLRVCGADEVDLFEAMCHQGSSPRVRSRPRQRYHGRAGTGIISACAEQTRRPEHALSNIRDHLRVCGADKDADMANRLSAGSSPRVRSRPVKAGGACFGVRIISACAEQTTRTRNISARTTDHLRVCGADRHRHPQIEDELGSSPRVRSRLEPLTAHAVIRRIISACAEQTVRQPYRRSA